MPFFTPHQLLTFSAPASKLAFVLQEAQNLAQQHPHLLQAISCDLDRHALRLKHQRLQDKTWVHPLQEALPITDVPHQAIPLNELSLQAGRPRMPAELCLMLLVIRGLFGGLKSQVVQDLLAESITFQNTLQRLGVSMPGASTMIENLNKISESTLDAIHHAQIRSFADFGCPDASDSLIVDSTHVHANTAWPTDSALIRKLMSSILNQLCSATRFGLKPFNEESVLSILTEVKKCDFQIAMVRGRNDAHERRKRLYEGLLEDAEFVSLSLTQFLAEEVPLIQWDALKPSESRRLRKIMDKVLRNEKRLALAISICRRRVIDGERVPASEKILSIADLDAALIVKGQREPALGYRPQVACNAGGFVTVVHVPRGNAPDAKELVNIVKLAQDAAGKTPVTVSTDDGYSSQAGLNHLKEMGVSTVSFSGSKGKRLVPEEDWDSPAYQEARRVRPCVESSIFQLKHVVNFGRVARRGIQAVRNEILEKVIAFNFHRLGFLVQREPG